MNKILVSTVILVNEKNQFLMEKHRTTSYCNNLWQFPGGKVEPNELIFEAAIREVFEELNISISITDLHPVSFIDYIKKPHQYIIFYFLCKKWSGDICNKENQIIDWFSLDEAKKMNVISYNKQTLEYLSKILKK